MKKTIRTILLVLSIGIMGYSGYKLWDINSEYAVGDKLYDDYANRFTVDTVEAAEVEEEKEASSLSIHFDALFEENEDIVGWIYSEGTPINYPVVQSSDNDYYLRRMLDGSHNLAGSIFMDYRNSPDLIDLNTIIYGHNMKNETMFGTLKEYRNQEYYEKHPEIYLFTPQEDYKIELIAGYQTDTSSQIYLIPEKIEELNKLYDQITMRSTFKTNTSFQEGDRLVTLSTCSDDGDDTERYVLIGKIVKK